MADGKQRAEWERTALIASVVHNSQCTKKSELKAPNDFNPFAKKKAAENTARVPFSMLVLTMAPKAKK